MRLSSNTIYMNWTIKFAPHILDQYDAEKNELNSLCKLKGEEAIFRSKVKWIEPFKPRKEKLCNENLASN